jgi:hypothetical protein
MIVRSSQEVLQILNQSPIVMYESAKQAAVFFHGEP